MLGVMYTQLSEVYLSKEQYTMAVKQLQRALKVVKKSDNQNLQAQLLHSLGNLHASDGINNSQKAIEYFSNGLEMAQNTDNTAYQAKMLIELARCHVAMDDLDVALAYLMDARQFKGNMEFRDEIILEQNIAGIYYEMGKPNDALNKYLIIEEEYGDQIDSANLVYLYIGIGTIYEYQKKQEKAEVYLTRAYEIAHTLGRATIISRVADKLSNHYYNVGNFKTAYSYEQKANNLQDSIADIAQNAINYQSQLLELENKKIELENINLRLFNQRLILAVAAVIFLLILISASFIFNVRLNKKNQEIAWQRADGIMREQELSLAHARIEGRNLERERVARDLHDNLGAMLSSVKMQVGSIEKRMGTLEEEVVQQFNIVSTILNESVEEIRRISHNMLVGALEKFGLQSVIIQMVEEIRKSSNMEVNLDMHEMDKQLDKQLEAQLYPIFQEIIKNTLKHSKAKRIDIQLNKFDDTIALMVQDDGVGFDKELVMTKQNSGIGLQNIQKRVSTLDGELSVETEVGKGTTISIEIPVKESYALPRKS